MNKSLRCLPVPWGAESEAHPDHFQLRREPLSGHEWSHREELPGLSLKLSQREAQGLEAHLGFPGAPFQPGGSLRPSKLPDTDGHPEGDGSSSRWAVQVCAAPATGPPGTALLGPTSPTGRRPWPCLSPLLLVWNPRSS